MTLILLHSNPSISVKEKLENKVCATSIGENVPQSEVKPQVAQDEKLAKVERY